MTRRNESTLDEAHRVVRFFAEWPAPNFDVPPGVDALERVASWADTSRNVVRSYLRAMDGVVMRTLPGGWTRIHHLARGPVMELV